MKKLISLILLALISSQMWAAVTSPDASKTATRNDTKAGKIIVYKLPTSYNSTTKDVPAIDLGTGVAWADRNIGAGTLSNPGTRTGDYVYWGGVATTTSASTSTWYSGITSMSNGDNLPHTNTADAAYKLMNLNWRIPTLAEWQALKDLCTYSGGSSSSASRRVTSKIDNTKYIDFPANTQYYTNGSSTKTRTNNVGYYWTSTLKSKVTGTGDKPGTSKPYYVTTSYSSFTVNPSLDLPSYNAMNIRPVYHPSFTTYTLTIIAGTATYQYICESGQKITVTPNAGDGYTFTGWSKTSGANLSPSGNKFTVTGDATYTANFVEDVTQYTVTINTPSNGTLQVKNGNSVLNSGDKVNENTTLTIVTTNSTAHYHCTSVSVLNGSTPVSVTNNQFSLTSNVTVSATFAEDDKFKVTINQPAEGGTLSVKNGNSPITSGVTEIYTGTTLTITPNPSAHYHLNTVSVMNGSTPVAVTNNTTFTLSSNVTVSGTFALDDKYTVTIAENEGGTVAVAYAETDESISVKAGDAVSTGTQVYANTKLTVTATADTEHFYQFTSWTDGTPALTNGQFTLSGAVTIGANFAKPTYTVRFYNGTSLLKEYANVVAGNEIIVLDNLETVYGETDVCVFDNWYEKDGNNNFTSTTATSLVTKSVDYYAKFNCNDIVWKTISAGTYSHGTVTLTSNKICQPLASNSSLQFAENTDINITATPERGYHFTGWTIGATTATIMVAGDGRKVVGINDDVTITPSFAQNEPFTMYDTWTQSDCANNYNTTDVLTVTLDGRTFTAGSWGTLSVPFDYTLESDEPLYGSIYKYSKLVLYDNSSVSVEFVRTYDIEANHPYLVVPRKNIPSVVFYGVTMNSAEEVALPEESRRKENDNVAFVSALWKQEIYGTQDFYVNTGNTLRYAKSTGTTIKGNRAFFRTVGDALNSSAPRRVRVVIDGEESEIEIAEDGTIEEVQSVRKYMENGVLIIECNGVRMDATGKKIN